MRVDRGRGRDAGLEQRGLEHEARAGPVDVGAEPGCGDQHARGAVAQHVLEPFARIAMIERHERGARLERGELGDDQLARRRREDRDDRFAAEHEVAGCAPPSATSRFASRFAAASTSP